MARRGVVREDLNRRGLLIAGAETHLDISYDDGENWKAFQLNLPVVPISDIAFQKREYELVVATQGRSFYILDDLPMVRQLAAIRESSMLRLFQPKDAYRLASGSGPAASAEGQNLLMEWWSTTG
jgi:hypothetical protein